MFDVGFWEIVLIFGLGLMILGPEKLPRVAAQLGRHVRERHTLGHAEHRQRATGELHGLVFDPAEPEVGPRVPSRC